MLAIGRQALAQSPPEPAATPHVLGVPAHTIVPPRFVTYVAARFPESQIGAGRGAVVDLRLSIDASGRVVAVTAVGAPAPAFAAAAIEAARQFVFAPATADGAPIPVKITYRTQFTLAERLVKKA